MAKPEDPRRLRWSVPRVDVSTNKWLDMQYDVSRSMQILIRESIQRDGYIDVANSPVEQLPRRGRPPQTESRVAEQDAKDEDQDLGDDTVWSAAEEVGQSTEKLKRRSVPDSTDSPTHDEPEQTSEATEPQPPTDEQRPVGGQVDMDAIFGHNG